MATQEDLGPTGRYIACPMGSLFHRRGAAIPVLRGKKCYWTKCECGFRAYLPRKWTASHGLSEKDAIKAGLLVVTNNLR